MPVPFSGGCACNALRYTVTEEPFVSYLCHCTACQKRTGSAFGMSLQVPTSGFSLDRGTPRIRKRIADSGNELIMRFCGDCGTTITGGSEARAHITIVFGGTLDAPSWVPIQAHIWADSALDWMPMDADIERFGKVPDFTKYHAKR